MLFGSVHCLFVASHFHVFSERLFLLFYFLTSEKKKEKKGKTFQQKQRHRRFRGRVLSWPPTSHTMTRDPLSQLWVTSCSVINLVEHLVALKDAISDCVWFIVAWLLFEFLYSTDSALNPMTWIVITTSSDCESCFATAAMGANPCIASASTWNCWHGFTAVIVLILTTTDTDSLSSRVSSYAPSILIASRTVSWLRPFLDEDPFGLFAAAVLPCEVLACSWPCSSCLPLALLFYQLQVRSSTSCSWACSFAVPIDHPVSSTWSSSSVSSLLLASLPCELFHAFSSARSSRAVSQHAPSRAARGDRSRAWLLWISRSCRQPALVRSCWGPECGRDRLVPRVHDVILPWQTHCEGERSCFACSVSASGASPSSEALLLRLSASVAAALVQVACLVCRCRRFGLRPRSF